MFPMSARRGARGGDPGADARQVLAGLGYDEDRIEALLAGGAVEETR